MTGKRKNWKAVFIVSVFHIFLGSVGYTQTITYTPHQDLFSSDVNIKFLLEEVSPLRSFVVQPFAHTTPHRAIQLAQSSNIPWWSTSIVQRKFPSKSQVGTLTQIYFPAVGHIENRWVKIGTRRYILAPNIQLRDQRNFIFIPNAVQLPVSVAFLASNNIVYKIWILRQEERKHFKQYLQR